MGCQQETELRGRGRDFPEMLECIVAESAYGMCKVGGAHISLGCGRASAEYEDLGKWQQKFHGQKKALLKPMNRSPERRDRNQNRTQKIQPQILDFSCFPVTHNNEDIQIFGFRNCL